MEGRGGGVIRDLTIDPLQAAGLRELRAAITAATDRYVVALSMVLRGHGIVQGSEVSLVGTTLTVDVPDAPEAV